MRRHTVGKRLRAGNRNPSALSSAVPPSARSMPIWRRCLPAGRPVTLPRPLVFKWFCRRSPFSRLPFGPLCHTGFFAVQFRADGVARLNELWQENARPRRSVARPIGGRRCCGSSVVEHSLGKGEVESSILSRSTINPLKSLTFSCANRRFSGQTGLARC